MRVLWVSFAVLLSTAPALAQPGGEMPRGFVGGLGGTTMGEAPTSAVFGAQAGIHLGRGVFAIGEFGQMQNLLPPGFQSELDLIARLVVLDGGGTFSLDGRVTAMYGLGGVRVMWPIGRWSPFAEGGAGVTRLRLHIDASGSDSSLAARIEEELRKDNPEASATKPLAAVGGGINIRGSSRWSADAGYRYYRIFTDDPAINVSSVYGALKFHF